MDAEDRREEKANVQERSSKVVVIVAVRCGADWFQPPAKRTSLGFERNVYIRSGELLC